MSVGDLLRYTFIGVIFLVLFAFGMKWRGKHKTEEAIVHELQSLTSTTSSFEQFYEADARKSLFLSIHQLYLGEKKLGLAPKDALDKVYGVGEGGGVFDQTDPSDYRRVDPAEELIRAGLLRNYENSKRLGIFGDTLSLEKLARGAAPQIKSGPAAGRTVQVGFIIDPKISPGFEKIIPNLVIRPSQADSAKPTELEVAQAKLLANSLHDAQIIERKAMDRIIAAYDEMRSEPKDEKEEEEKDE